MKSDGKVCVDVYGQLCKEFARNIWGMCERVKGDRWIFQGKWNIETGVSDIIIVIKCICGKGGQMCVWKDDMKGEWIWLVWALKREKNSYNTVLLVESKGGSPDTDWVWK